MVLYDVSESNWKGSMDIWCVNKAVSNYGGLSAFKAEQTLGYPWMCSGPANLHQSPIWRRWGGWATSLSHLPWITLVHKVPQVLLFSFRLCLEAENVDVFWLCCLLGTFLMHRRQNHQEPEDQQKRKYFSSLTTRVNEGELHKAWVVKRPRNDSRKSRVYKSPSALCHNNRIYSRHCAESS